MTGRGLMKLLGAALLSMLSLFEVPSFGATSSECKNLKEEIMAMEQAQSQIVKSLVHNHESMASHLEDYSSVVSKITSSEIHKISQDMKDSAIAFRERGVKGKKIAKQLDVSTRDLMERVIKCLK